MESLFEPASEKEKEGLGGATVTTLLCPYGARGKIKQPEALASHEPPSRGITPKKLQNPN